MWAAAVCVYDQYLTAQDPATHTHTCTRAHEILLALLTFGSINQCLSVLMSVLLNLLV